MFEPVRGGTRGGQAEFKWSDVSADKDREHYLGHSINAPTGRWQKNKDVHWYNRDKKDTDEEKAAEIRRIKELEADALSVALGFDPAPKDQGPSASAPELGPAEALELAKEKEEKRRRKAERKEEKAAKKQAKLERKARERGEDYRRSRDRSRSRSPRRHRSSRSPHSRPGRDYSQRSLSLAPRSSHQSERRAGNDYDAEERERERERDRRRWEINARRELPSHRR
ncbi:hypothetical protein NP233_g9405 [Leucocoprinus birnbaumii]|uniref:Multiple myeloma tumor-associated protein 2-like N-terminal domain-containing protein n=1 Tax=Leucocoprinus birnbaumii TaxID=56174 RepID=A0AAD5VNY8_9AGAR|nr:hypothetical protein NP233_g9405 [Leucocoprinus birnbaumii]